MRQNPMLAHLLRKAGSPPVWLTAIFTALVFAWTCASMLPGLDAMLTRGAPVPEGETWLLIAALVTLMGIPVMVGVNAAVFTSRHAEPDNLKKLKLAGVSKADKVWGYALAAMHRMRIPIAMEVGLAPALVIGITEIMLVFYQALHPGCAAGGPCVGIAAEATFDAGHWLLVHALLVAGVAGLTPLAAALGAWAALTWKRPVIAPAVVVAVMATLSGLFVTMIDPGNPVSLPVAIVAGIGPFVLAVAVLWLGGIERERGNEKSG